MEKLLSVLWRLAIFGYVQTGRVRQMDDKGVGEDVELVTRGVQLHRVRHFVPAEAQESLVVAHHVAAYHHVRFEIRLPFDLNIVKFVKEIKHIN